MLVEGCDGLVGDLGGAFDYRKERTDTRKVKEGCQPGMAQNLKGESCTVQPTVAPKAAPTATPDNYQKAFDTAVQNAQKLGNFAQSGGNVCKLYPSDCTKTDERFDAATCSCVKMTK